MGACKISTKNLKNQRITYISPQKWILIKKSVLFLHFYFSFTNLGQYHNSIVNRPEFYLKW